MVGFLCIEINSLVVNIVIVDMHCLMFSNIDAWLTDHL